MTATPDLEQTRHLATELPGPRSRELAERQKRAVPAGVATTMPVYAASAPELNRAVRVSPGIGLVRSSCSATAT